MKSQRRRRRSRTRASGRKARANVRVAVVGECSLTCCLFRMPTRQIPGLAVVLERAEPDQALRMIQTAGTDAVVCQLGESFEIAARLARATRRRRSGPCLVGVLCREGFSSQARAALGSKVPLVRPSDGMPGLLAALETALPPDDERRSLLAAARRRPAGPGSEDERQQAAPQALTSRQRQVLRLVALGRTSAQIARELGLSQRTVDCHRSNLLKRLGAASIAEAVRKAMLRGILT